MPYNRVKSTEEREMDAEEFNEWYQPGTPVIYTDDFGNEEQTVTTSIAWDLCGTPVVKLEGKRGGYDIERVKVLEAHKSRG